MAEAPGTKIGAYRIIGPIGSGAFATVYRAVDERFDTEVAIKILAENHSLEPQIRERFLSEARLLRRLSHPNLITVFDIGETARRQPFIVLELALCSLRERRAEATGVSARDVHEVAEALGAALGVLHREHVVHRDVSPQNVLVLGPREPGPRRGLLADGERLALADLGFAKDLAVHSGLTVGGGTAGFSPPDQRRGATIADPLDDVYSASAVVAWVAVDGAASDDTTPRTDLLLPSPSGSLAIELDRGMARARSKRHPDIQHWRDAITRSLETPVTPQVPTPSQSRSRRRNPATIAVGLLAALIIGAIIGWAVGPGAGADTGFSDEVVDGRRRVQVVDDEIAAAIFGPPEIAVGDQVSFDAGVAGGVSYFWVAPDAQLIAEEPTLTIPQVTATMTAVSLVVVDADGRAVSVTYPFIPTDG